jgi:small subunit ribosomal protein S2
MSTISIREMLEAGVHFGHQTQRWNPKMKPYIFGSKNGIHIVNLQKTVIKYDEAHRFVARLVAGGRKVMFVGTKKQAQEIVAEEATRAGQFYVNNRWLGGIKDMKSLPAAMVIIDVKKEHIAVREAQRLGIPIVAVVDINCDPDPIDFVVPGNDDALKSIKLFLQRLADACLEGGHSHAARSGGDIQGEYTPVATSGDIEVAYRRIGTEAEESDDVEANIDE